MAEKENPRDGRVHSLESFSNIYEDVDIKTKDQYDAERRDGLYKFTGDFNISPKSEHIRYSLFQVDPIENIDAVPVRVETVPVFRTSSDSPTGFTITYSPDSAEIPTDRFGKFEGDTDVTINITIARNKEPLKIKKIDVYGSLPSGIKINSKTNAEIGYLVLTAEKGGSMGDVADDMTRVVFTVTAEDNSTEQFDFKFIKEGKHLSLGRINYDPTTYGKKLTDVTYTDSTGKVVTGQTMYAKKGDIVVLITPPAGTTYMVGSTFQWTGSNWVLVTDLTSATLAFEDIMSIADSTTAQLICKRLVAQQALIRELASRTINLTYDDDNNMGSINAGYYVDKKRWPDNGFQVKADGTVNIKGGSITVDGGKSLDEDIAAKIKASEDETAKKISETSKQKVAKTQTVYLYKKASDPTLPNAPDKFISETNVEENKWKITRPSYPENTTKGSDGIQYALYTCVQVQFDDAVKDSSGKITTAATFKNSDVVEDKSFYETYVMTKGKTIIKGGWIDTQIINAKQINVGDLGDGANYASKTYVNSQNTQTCFLYSKSSSTPAGPGKTWVSAATSKDDTWGNTYPAYPTVTKSNPTRYYLFTCTQTKNEEDSSVSQSGVVRDYSYDETWAKTQGVTIIENGYIETSLIKAGSITIGKLGTDTKSAIDTAQSTANTASSKADGAQSTANTARSEAGAAQSTANAASSAASNAQGTADAAKTKAEKIWAATGEGKVTIIDGGHIVTSLIETEDLFSRQIEITNEKSGYIKTSNYDPNGATGFMLKADGSAYFRNVDISGNLTSRSITENSGFSLKDATGTAIISTVHTNFLVARDDQYYRPDTYPSSQYYPIQVGSPMTTNAPILVQLNYITDLSTLFNRGIGHTEHNSYWLPIMGRLTYKGHDSQGHDVGGTDEMSYIRFFYSNNYKIIAYIEKYCYQRLIKNINGTWYRVDALGSTTGDGITEFKARTTGY